MGILHIIPCLKMGILHIFCEIKLGIPCYLLIFVAIRKDDMGTNRVFRRKLYDKMLEWKKSSNGATALLVKGARRVGKSTLVEEFAKNEYRSYILVDFADAPSALWEAVDIISDRNDFFTRLQFIYGVKLYERESAIIFDEVQKCPRAREAIKYLVKDHRYDYIETGSLLSIKKNTQGIVIPSEETRLTMYPMDYEEFRWALGDEVTVPLLKESFDAKRPFGDALTRKLLRDFRLYMLVGGMPQAVNEYIETLNLADVDRKKREIIELYLDDFVKIDPSGKISKLFSSIPAQLSKNASRFQQSAIVGRGYSSETIDEFLRDLEDSLTVNFAHHSDNPEVGLPSHSDYNQYKLYVSDTGLFITLAFWDNDFSDNTIYEKLLSDKLSVDLGYVYENIVAQMLVSSGHKLFYHTWRSETSNHNYEVDFLLSKGTKVRPVEVKSSGYKTHRSLDEFCRKYSGNVGDRYLIYTKDLRRDGQTLLIPVMLTMFI